MVFYRYDNGAIEMNVDVSFYTAATALLVNITASNIFYYWIRSKLGREKAFLIVLATAQNLPLLVYIGARFLLGVFETMLFYSALAIYLSSITIIFTQYRRLVWHGIPCVIDLILLALWG